VNRPQTATDQHLRSALGVAGVLVLLVLFASQMYIWINWWPIRIDWPTALAWSLPQYLIWLTLAPLVLRANRRWPLEHGPRGIRILGHLIGSILFSAVGLGILDLSDRVFHWAPLMGAPTLVTSVKYTIIHLHWGTAIYWLVIAADQTLKYYAESRETAIEASQLSEQLDQATLTALRSQLNPHFLFNTLNSIAVSIRQDPARAEGMVYRLADFLRLTLSQSDRSVIALKDELDFAVSYLDIERNRFADRLAVRIEVDPPLLEVSVPTLILQPLVENAVKHGIGPRPGGGTITIRGKRAGDRLELSVSDDGAGPSRKRPDGVGLANVRRRLDTHFAGRAELVTGPGDRSGFVARLFLPLDRGAPTMGVR
jgi:two-component system, LytTR family, sensor kinase